MLLNNKGKPRTLLSDRVREALTRMKAKKQISEQVADELLDVFNPAEGIDLDCLVE